MFVMLMISAVITTAIPGTYTTHAACEDAIAHVATHMFSDKVDPGVKFVCVGAN